jgi:hypothetical protein
VGVVGNLFIYSTSVGYRVIDVGTAKKSCGFITDSAVVAIDGSLFISVDGQLHKIKAVGDINLCIPLAETSNLVIPHGPPSVDLNWGGIAHVKLAVSRILSEAAAAHEAEAEARKAKESVAKAVKAAELRKQPNYIFLCFHINTLAGSPFTTFQTCEDCC